ncbi:hypothetical protein BURPS1710A_4194 [Burkholderia pseudomallei 1710a]|uniref:Uncharacterized protein n=1 Tax=Burkholderia pseudomallei 1710a TaxID=320371 RepID=A0A0E1W0W8_BURPE|nr:hypothetical protein BURPS1710A_4194 [Burkholderia pseudomallei 1710a]
MLAARCELKPLNFCVSHRIVPSTSAVGYRHAHCHCHASTNSSPMSVVPLSVYQALEHGEQ